MIPANYSDKNYDLYKRAQELTKRLNSGELDWLPNKDKEQIALIAMQYGQDFKVKGKPIRKALFDLVDTAAFGLVPNKWRPKSVGEDYFGETAGDKWASGIGSAIGLVAGGAGILKGAGALGKWWKGSKAVYPTAEGSAQANKMLQLNPGRDVPLLPEAPNLLQMSRNQQLRSGRSERLRNLESLIQDEADLIAGF